MEVAKAKVWSEKVNILEGSHSATLFRLLNLKEQSRELITLILKEYNGMIYTTEQSRHTLGLNLSCSPSTIKNHVKDLLDVGIIKRIDKGIYELNSQLFSNQFDIYLDGIIVKTNKKYTITLQLRSIGRKYMTDLKILDRTR